MSKYIPFLSSTFIKQLDAAAEYIYRELSEQYSSQVGVEFADALMEEIRDEINNVCAKPDIYLAYEFCSSSPVINERLNSFKWKSANTKRFHNRLFFFYEKSNIYFVCLYGSGQNTDHLIVEDIDYKELGLEKSIKLE